MDKNQKARLLRQQKRRIALLEARYQEDIDKWLYREEMIRWLQSFAWNYFLTVTFETEQKPALSYSTLAKVGHMLSRQLGNSLRIACLITAPHTSGFLHIHGLVHISHPLPHLIAIPFEMAAERAFGFTQLSPIRKRERAVYYCARYLTRDLTDYIIL